MTVDKDGRLENDAPEKLYTETELAQAVCFAQAVERGRASRIAREQFLVTPNGRDCGEHIATKILEDD